MNLRQPFQFQISRARAMQVYERWCKETNTSQNDVRAIQIDQVHESWSDSRSDFMSQARTARYDFQQAIMFIGRQMFKVLIDNCMLAQGFQTQASRCVFGNFMDRVPEATKKQLSKCYADMIVQRQELRSAIWISTDTSFYHASGPSQPRLFVNNG